MLYMPYYYFFVIMLVTGSLMSISSSNWLYVWMGLEINLLSFIPLVMHGTEDLEVESMIKYFLVQSLGSCMILFIYLSMNMYLIDDLFFINIMMVFSFMIKMGMFPFHFWLVHVMSGIGWVSCMILSIWQKLGPLFITSSLIGSSMYGLFFTLGAAGSILGGLLGMNQSYMRTLLAYSSIGHMGWMLSGMLCSFNLLIFYYIVYSVSMISIMIFMNLYSVHMINSMNYSVFPLFLIFLLSILFLSLGGFPPFLGFYPKLITINYMLDSMMIFDLLILVVGSMMNIFFYINIIFNLMLKSIFSISLSSEFSVNLGLSFMLSLFGVFSLFGLLILL